MFKALQLTLIAIGIFTIASCGNSDNDLLSEESLVLEHFTLQEAEELQKIHDFFITHVSNVKDPNSSEAIDDLTHFLIDLKEAGSTGVIEIPISYEEEKNLIGELSTSLIDKIWDKDTEIGYLNMHPLSDYVQFLLELGKEHPIAKDYAEKIQQAGTISSTVISSLLMSPEKYDTNVNAIRLLIAIHYITIDYNNNLSADVIY